jgi:RNA polymerase-binding transcription factor DksA
MPEIDRDQVEKRLEERLEQIARRRQAIRRNAEGMGDELADYDNHPADQGTETFEQELDETTEMILEAEEKQVAEARRLLEKGRYGICVDCGKEIPAERLEAIPESIRCVEDQRIYEARLRQTNGPAPTR